MFCEGFDDWKNSAYITNHIMGKQHTFSISRCSARKKVSCKIDTQIESQFLEALAYWTNILRCIVETIVFLAKCGLPFSQMRLLD